MPNPAISREDVHTLAEACSDAGDDFRPVATRLLREQKPLTNFLQENMPVMKGNSGEVALYMFAVILRIFDQYGGRMGKVTRAEARASAQRVKAAVDQLRPFDDSLPERVRAIDWRAQPHILDEVLWALYEREEKQENEIDVPPEQSALVFLLMWAAVEALDARWRPPR
ncbi:MAG: hypothetical protein H6739_10595 [Alphaproteobacteria bacterium]|nr:hypothetical protein [Alphaproteobacteria bacterium]